MQMVELVKLRRLSRRCDKRQSRLSNSRRGRREVSRHVLRPSAGGRLRETASGGMEMVGVIFQPVRGNNDGLEAYPTFLSWLGESCNGYQPYLEMSAGGRRSAGLSPATVRTIPMSAGSGLCRWLQLPKPHRMPTATNMQIVNADVFMRSIQEFPLAVVDSGLTEAEAASRLSRLAFETYQCMGSFHSWLVQTLRSGGH
jgi:hypothetical protein